MIHDSCDMFLQAAKDLDAELNAIHGLMHDREKELESVAAAAQAQASAAHSALLTSQKKVTHKSYVADSLFLGWSTVGA